MIIKFKPGRNCNHPTCSGKCRREKKPKKRYVLKRSYIKKKTGYKIPKVSAKRATENEIYFAGRDEFLKAGNCELKTPVCTKKSTCIHHTEGRVGADFLDKKKMKRSCHPCNNWVEENSKEAKELGLKKPNYTSKLTGLKKL